MNAKIDGDRSGYRFSGFDVETTVVLRAFDLSVADCSTAQVHLCMGAEPVGGPNLAIIEAENCERVVAVIEPDDVVVREI